MQLDLDPRLAENYISRAQVAKVLTETWARDQLYCPACPSETVEPTPSGTAVIDFRCPDCEEPFQLKSQSRPFHSRVNDSAYGTMIHSVEAATAPSFCFLHYDSSRWRVRNLFFVPRHFLSASAIEKRPPLRPGARREGWVGCNILLSALPADARVYAVQEETSLPPEDVREAWRAFSFLRQADPESRGWIADVLACVREIRKDEFTLAEFYRFEGRLGRMHLDNRNVRPKIRQQLQVLRDHGVLDFLGRGEYQLR